MNVAYFLRKPICKILLIWYILGTILNDTINHLRTTLYIFKYFVRFLLFGTKSLINISYWQTKYRLTCYVVGKARETRLNLLKKLEKQLEMPVFAREFVDVDSAPSASGVENDCVKYVRVRNVLFVNISRWFHLASAVKGIADNAKHAQEANQTWSVTMGLNLNKKIAIWSSQIRRKFFNLTLSNFK